MGWVQELADLFKKLQFYNLVNEYDQGLYYFNGRARERKIRHLEQSELEDILKAEKEVRKTAGHIKYLVPFARPKVPEGYRRSKINGGLRSNKRYSKNLRAGTYFYVPLIGDVIVRRQQEKPLNLGNTEFMATDKDGDIITMNASCTVRYKLSHLHKAFSVVEDYETSVKEHTLAILAKHCRGKTLTEWLDPKTIETLETNVEREVRAIVTEKWGMKIFKIYVTDVAPCDMHRLLCENNNGKYDPAITPTINLQQQSSS